MFSFPTNQVGNHVKATSRFDEIRSNWGNGTHPYFQQYEHSYREWVSQKSVTVHGDHVHALPYSRYAARVVSNKPVLVRASGSDGNGAWFDERKLYMSQWLPLGIMDQPPSLAEEIINLQRHTVVQLLGKLREGKQGWGANVFQARQTADMMAGSTLRVLGAANALRKGNIRGVLDNLGIRGKNGKQQANDWLQYIYGWLPLMSDVHDGYKTLSTILGEQRLTRSVQKSKRMAINATREFQGFSDRWDGVVKCRAGLTVIDTNDLSASLDTMGLINPLEIAWDLVPFSFVFDWFIPVGDVLSALSATIGLDFVTGYMSTVVDIRKNARCVNPYIFADGRFKLEDGGELNTEAFSFDRVAWEAFPSPEFFANSSPLSTSRILAAVALIRQRI